MKGKIYRIICNITGLQYIGSTTYEYLSKRLSCHVSSFKKGNYETTAWMVLQGGNYEIILIEEVEVENKDQLRQRERHYIETMECVNLIIPYRTEEERQQWRTDNKERLKELWQNWYADNKERLAETVECECGAVIAKRHLEEHRQRPQHQYNMLPQEEKDRIEDGRKANKKAYKAEWFQQNKERVYARRNQRTEEQKQRDKQLKKEWFERNKERIYEQRRQKKLASTT